MNKKQNDRLTERLAEIEYHECLEGLSPKEKANRLIKRIKTLGSVHEGIRQISSDRFLYLISDNCELNWEQKDFIIYVYFYFENLAYYEDDNKIMLKRLEEWGIIDALKLYNDDEQAGIKWFESHKIPMRHVYSMLSSHFYEYHIAKKYPELKSLPKKYSQAPKAIGIDALFKQATDLLKKGDYEKSHYDILNVCGSDVINRDAREFSDTLRKQIFNVKTPKEMIKYLVLVREFGWLKPGSNVRILNDSKTQEHILKVLNIDPKYRDINNLDLKNPEDIAIATKIFPLVLSCPWLFINWYPSNSSGAGGYYFGARPLFVPDHDNGLARKRLELHHRLKRGNSLVGKIISKTLVPKKLGKVGTKLEKTVADSLYQAKRPGRR